MLHPLKLHRPYRGVFFLKLCFTHTQFRFITGVIGKISRAFILQKARENVLTIISGLKTCEIFDRKDNTIAMDTKRKTDNSRMGT